MKTRTTLVLAAALLGIVTPARAEDPAAAEALFNKGLADMEAGRYSQGCGALGESQRLDPRPGTLFTLADCEAKAGKIATAKAHFEMYLRAYDRLTPEQQARQRGRNKVAAARMEELAPRVATLTLVLPETAPESTIVTRDEAVLRGPLLGIPLPVDPGDHDIVTQVPGGTAHHRQVTVGAGEHATIELEVLPAPDAREAAPDRRAAIPAPSPSGSRRPIAYAVGGVGLASLVAGGVTGAVFLVDRRIANTQCAGGPCTPAGLSAATEARRLEIGSAVSLGVGAAALAAGLVLLLTDGSRAAGGPAAIVGGPIAGAPGAWVGVGGVW